jgi:uroporphyrinogen-III synthase
MNRSILILRPEPGNQETALRAMALGLVTISYPLFSIRPLPWDAPEPAHYTGLLLTSANAVREAGAALARYIELPVQAVGSATAKAAAQAGFSNIMIGKGGVDAVIAQISSGRLLHLCGQDVTEAAPSSVRIDRRAVYTSDVGATDTLSPHLAQCPIALLHSSRAASRFAELVPEREKIAVAAISDAVAEAAGDGWQAIAIANSPSDEALLAAAKSLTSAL